MKRGQIGDFEITPAPLILAVVGAGIGLFTAQGGFNGEGFDAGRSIRIISLLAGAVIGFIWGKMMEE